MKNLIKLALAFALGILVTMFVIIPMFQTPAEPAPTPDIQAEIKDAVDAAVKEALESTALEVEPLNTPATPEPAEVEESPEPEVIVQEAAATPEPTTTAEPKKTQPASSPQVKKTEPAEPEYFYEDGKKYAIINGFKSLISDEPDGQIETYDWENDPLSEVKGPFN